MSLSRTIFPYINRYTRREGSSIWIHRRDSEHFSLFFLLPYVEDHLGLKVVIHAEYFLANQLQYFLPIESSSKSLITCNHWSLCYCHRSCTALDVYYFGSLKLRVCHRSFFRDAFIISSTSADLKKILVSFFVIGMTYSYCFDSTILFTKFNRT